MNKRRQRTSPCAKCIRPLANFTEQYKYKICAVLYIPTCSRYGRTPGKYSVYRKSDRFIRTKRPKEGIFVSNRMCTREILSSSRASPFLPPAKPVARPCTICARWPYLSSLLIANPLMPIFKQLHVRLSFRTLHWMESDWFSLSASR